MFFDNAAASAQGKGGGFVRAFRVKQSCKGERGRGRIGRIKTREVDPNHVAPAVCADEESGVRFAIETGIELPGKVHADMQNLVGVGEHGWNRGGEFEAQGNGSCLQLRSHKAGGGLQYGVDIEGSKLGWSLIGKGEEARYQRGRAPHLFGDLRGLQLFLGWQGGRAEQFGISQHGGERVVDLVRGAAD